MKYVLRLLRPQMELNHRQNYVLPEFGYLLLLPQTGSRQRLVFLVVEPGPRLLTQAGFYHRLTSLVAGLGRLLLGHQTKYRCRLKVVMVKFVQSWLMVELFESHNGELAISAIKTFKGCGLSSRVPASKTFSLRFSNLLVQILWVDFCFRNAPLTNSKDLYTCGVGHASSLRTFYLEVLGCQYDHFRVHWYCSFTRSSSSGFSYSSQKNFILRFLKKISGLVTWWHFEVWCPRSMHTPWKGVQFIHDVSSVSKLPESNSSIMSVVDISLFFRSELPKTTLMGGDLLVVVGFFLNRTSSSFAGFHAVVSFFLRSLPAVSALIVWWLLRSLVAQGSSFPCVVAIFIVDPEVIPLSAPSLTKRHVGAQPTMVGESCKSDGYLLPQTGNWRTL